MRLALFLSGMGVIALLVFSKRFDLFFVFVLVTLVVTAVLVKLSRPAWAKWVIGIFSLIVFWEMGHIDEILGEREHKELCTREAGVKVFKKAKLPPEFYNTDGTPNFFRNGDPEENRLKEYVLFQRSNAVVVSDKFLRIEKLVYEIKDTNSGNILARKVNFAAWPSPFIPTIAHEGARLCEPTNMPQSSKAWRDMYRQVFNRED